jgi:hypothetical protein
MTLFFSEMPAVVFMLKTVDNAIALSRNMLLDVIE